MQEQQVKGEKKKKQPLLRDTKERKLWKAIMTHPEGTCHTGEDCHSLIYGQEILDSLDICNMI